MCHASYYELYEHATDSNTNMHICYSTVMYMHVHIYIIYKVLHYDYVQESKIKSYKNCTKLNKEVKCMHITPLFTQFMHLQ